MIRIKIKKKGGNLTYRLRATGKGGRGKERLLYNKPIIKRKPFYD